MEITGRETLDLMKKDSFSQLPHVRQPSKEKDGVRLFGINFEGGANSQPEELESMELGDAAGRDDDEPRLEESKKRFECHFCCRNFPTSQALGGHQNAHKRERQHAKKAQLQSAAAMIHQANFPTTSSHIYSLVNYQLKPHLPSSAGHGSLNNSTAYPPWHSNLPTPHGRLYGTHQPAINGNPTGSWRIPPPGIIGSGNGYHRHWPMTQPAHHISKVDTMKRPALEPVSNGGFYEYPRLKTTVKDNLSLDLHLSTPSTVRASSFL